MKKLGLIVLAIIAVSVAGCVKDAETFDYAAQLEKEKPLIKAYVEQNLPNAILDEYTQIWYELVNPGIENSYVYRLDQNGTSIVSPTITVNYEGKLLNGQIFDSNNTPAGAVFDLGTLITAWHAAFIPKVVQGIQTIGITEQGLQKGAEIRIVTPSYLGYRNSQNGAIPANSPLVFTIKVLEIK